MKEKISYSHFKYLSELEDDKYAFIQDSQDIGFWLDFTGMIKKYRKDITGIVVLVEDGDLCAIWLTESNRPYCLDVDYYSLPYYRPKYWVKKNLPEYWLESNKEYWD